jgi:hypothetical protein
MLTITLDQQSCLDKKLAGGKGHGLAGMLQAGIPVAPGFVIWPKPDWGPASRRPWARWTAPSRTR